MYIIANHMNLYYEVTGHGDPIVLVHGNGEDGTIFDQAVNVLAKTHTCYVVDSRGHGRSQHVKEYHYQDMADDMTAFMKALDLRNVIFYGFSDGGIIGLLTAMKTDRIRYLIISGANIDPWGLGRVSLYKSKFHNHFKQDPLETLMIEEPNITKEMLQKITIPVLVLAGEHDLILEKHTRKIADWLPNANCQILPGENHGSYIVHKTRIATLILTYLKFMEDHEC